MIILHVQPRPAGPQSGYTVPVGDLTVSIWETVTPPRPGVITVSADAEALTPRSALGPGLIIECATVAEALTYLEELLPRYVCAG